MNPEADAERRDRPTMRDVAALAGVGIKTVSRVVNDVPTVAPELVERVRAAADKLGYRHNLTAANLRRTGGRTNTIGLLLEDVSNPYSSAVLRAVEDYAMERRVLVLAASLDENPQREREMTRALIDRRVDGLIVVPAGRDQRYVLTEQQAGTSFVFVDRLPVPLLADAIVSDNRGGATRAVRHLLDRPRASVAYLGDDLGIPTAVERFGGFTDALTSAGMPVDEGLVRHGLRTAEQARAAAHELFATKPPAAVFTSQNLVTIGVVEALHELGLHNDVALVGFDDIPFASVLQPGITVMAQDPVALGRSAAERLFARLAGDSSPAAVTTVPTELIVRGSGEL
ncbi:MAG TPA: LacI family DNA-binding transcriptional regulator [Jatrophihabitantaceae bacterium]|nr:LacI family DNA-binding transcriptional regulator [Jatrophihabitantaceae bacterium]